VHLSLLTRCGRQLEKGKVKIEPKEKIIDRLKASPDIAESALLCFVPSSWAADLDTASAAVMAPSLLTDYSPSDLVFGRGGHNGW
jgi:hypothetical protein